MAEISDFWSEYAASVRREGVPEKRVRWYLGWAERFARACRGVPLRERSRQDVRAFLDDLKADEQITPWQVEQARDAIRILYRKHLGLKPDDLPAAPPPTRRDVVMQPRQLEALHGSTFDAMRTALRVRRLSPRTETAYLGWVRRFLTFHELKSPDELNADHVRSYLNYLATEKGVGSSTQNQGLNAIVFLFKHVLGRDPGDFSDFVRAKTPQRRPQVLSREQVAALLDELGMPFRLAALLMYGSGLRVMECLGLRIGDLQRDEGTIRVHGKGAKERLVGLPPELAPELEEQLVVSRKVYESDRVHESALRWEEAWLFPSESLRIDERSRRVARAHLHRNGVAQALRRAAERARIPLNVTPHLLRHSFASHSVDDGVHILDVQELLGHAQLSTTTIYTHPMNRPGRRPGSPLASPPD